MFIHFLLMARRRTSTRGRESENCSGLQVCQKMTLKASDIFQRFVPSCAFQTLLQYLRAESCASEILLQLQSRYWSGKTLEPQRPDLPPILSFLGSQRFTTLRPARPEPAKTAPED